MFYDFLSFQLKFSHYFSLFTVLDSIAKPDSNQIVTFSFHFLKQIKNLETDFSIVPVLVKRTMEFTDNWADLIVVSA